MSYWKINHWHTLLTCCVCWIFVFSSFSIPPCTIFRRSFIAPANAASGSSSSVFICPAIFWCDLPICSTSPLTTSREARSVPASSEPNGFRESANSLRAYSSSIAERACSYQSCIVIILIRRTCVEGLQLIACLLGILHPLKERVHACISRSPEVIRNCKIVS